MFKNFLSSFMLDSMGSMAKLDYLHSKPSMFVQVIGIYNQMTGFVRVMALDYVIVIRGTVPESLHLVGNHTLVTIF